MRGRLGRGIGPHSLTWVPNLQPDRDYQGRGFLFDMGKRTLRRLSSSEARKQNARKIAFGHAKRRKGTPISLPKVSLLDKE
jgi:hypothetical protein